MSYLSFIETIKNKCASSKSNLYFVNATDKEFNSNDSRDFPLVWLRNPVTSNKQLNANNIIVQEVFNFELQVLQTIGLTTTTESEPNINKFYSDTNYILIALLNDLLKNDYQITIGQARQVFKKTDLNTIGWAVPIQITFDVNNNLCCEFFNQ